MTRPRPSRPPPRPPPAPPPPPAHPPPPPPPPPPQKRGGSPTPKPSGLTPVLRCISVCLTLLLTASISFSVCLCNYYKSLSRLLLLPPSNISADCADLAVQNRPTYRPASPHNILHSGL